MDSYLEDLNSFTALQKQFSVPSFDEFVRLDHSIMISMTDSWLAGNLRDNQVAVGISKLRAIHAKYCNYKMVHINVIDGSKKHTFSTGLTASSFRKYIRKGTFYDQNQDQVMSFDDMDHQSSYTLEMEQSATIAKILEADGAVSIKTFLEGYFNSKLHHHPNLIFQLADQPKSNDLFELDAVFHDNHLNPDIPLVVVSAKTNVTSDLEQISKVQLQMMQHIEKLQSVKQNPTKYKAYTQIRPTLVNGVITTPSHPEYVPIHHLIQQREILPIIVARNCHPLASQYFEDKKILTVCNSPSIIRIQSQNFSMVPKFHVPSFAEFIKKFLHKF